MDETQDSDRLKEIFAVASHLSPESRGAYLDKACGSGTELRRRIDEMLARQAATWVDGGSPDLDGTRVAAGPVLARAMNEAASGQLPGALLPGALIDGKYRIDHVTEGDTVADVLKYVQFAKGDLVRRVRRATELAVKEGRMTLEDAAKMINAYQGGLEGYTYLEE